MPLVTSSIPGVFSMFLCLVKLAKYFLLVRNLCISQIQFIDRMIFTWTRIFLFAFFLFSNCINMDFFCSFISWFKIFFYNLNFILWHKSYTDHSLWSVHSWNISHHFLFLFEILLFTTKWSPEDILHSNKISYSWDSAVPTQFPDSFLSSKYKNLPSPQSNTATTRKRYWIIIDILCSIKKTKTKWHSAHLLWSQQSDLLISFSTWSFVNFFYIWLFIFILLLNFKGETVRKKTEKVFL